jgi:hypothetical protein
LNYKIGTPTDESERAKEDSMSFAVPLAAVVSPLAVVAGHDHESRRETEQRRQEAER